MTTTDGSASNVGSVAKIEPTALERRLRIGSAAEVREVVDYNQQMEIVMSTIPSTVSVRWVGINNSQQIERHLQNGYEYVLREDGIKTLTGLDKTDASGQYVVVGDCVLMACSKEALKHRQKEIANRTRHRLDSTIRAEEFQEQVAQRGLKVYTDDERMAQHKS